MKEKQTKTLKTQWMKADCSRLAQFGKEKKTDVDYLSQQESEENEAI